MYEAFFFLSFSFKGKKLLRILGRAGCWGCGSGSQDGGTLSVRVGRRIVISGDAFLSWGAQQGRGED